MSGNKSGPLAGRRVLVVEDEFFIADDVASALRKLDAEVLGPFGTQGDALAMLESGNPIDLAVLDIDLHGQTSFTLAQALEKRGVPFLFATGFDRAVVPDELRKIPLWEKPFDVAALMEALSVLDQPHR